MKNITWIYNVNCAAFSEFPGDITCVIGNNYLSLVLKQFALRADNQRSDINALWKAIKPASDLSACGAGKRYGLPLALFSQPVSRACRAHAQRPVTDKAGQSAENKKRGNLFNITAFSAGADVRPCGASGHIRLSRP